MEHQKIIALDFDGTLFEEDYPRIGAPIWKTIDRAKEEKRNGAILILWTCRQGKYLVEAVNACKDVGLTFDKVNQNADQIIESWGVDQRKIFANEYWDDRGVNPNWLTSPKRVNDVQELVRESSYPFELCESIYSLFWENLEMSKMVLQTASILGVPPLELSKRLGLSVSGEKKE